MNALQRLVFCTAITVAVVALAWPYIPWQYVPGSQKVLDSAKCPLGYEAGDAFSASDLPQDHPPVPPSKARKLTGTLFFNCNIITMSEEMPQASAMLVDSNGKIQQVMGTTPDAEDFEKSVDLQGGVVVPGFVDAHVHLLPGGLSLLEVNLRGVSSKQEFVDLIREAAEKLRSEAAAAAAAGASGAEGAAQNGEQEQPPRWIWGTGWDDNQIPEGLPSAEWIDEVAADIPVVLVRMDAHMVVVNSLVLRLAGITSATPDPPDGSIDKDSNGNPTGILRENALKLATSLIPEYTQEQLQAAFSAATRHLLSKGITSVGDLGRYPFLSADPDATWRDLEQIYEPAVAAGQLPVRIMAYVPLRTWQRAAFKLETAGRSARGGRLHLGGVKEFADGSLGSRTALMWEPYSDDSSTAGIRSAPHDELAANSRAAAQAGLQVAVHAIGDRAVDEVLEVYEGLSAPTLGPRGCTHRIEHVQHISGPEAAEKLAKLGVWAVGNPQHLLSDVGMLTPRLGDARAGPGRAFAFSTLSKAGARLSFGSDWPVVEVGPLEAIYAAAFRRAPGSEGSGWAAAEKLHVLQALQAHTLDAARTLCLDHLVGSIRSGLRADFVVLDKHPAAMEKEAMPQVVATWVDGQCAYGGCGE